MIVREINIADELRSENKSIIISRIANTLKIIMLANVLNNLVNGRPSSSVDVILQEADEDISLFDVVSLVQNI
ncbi:MAG: hypothetical protein OEM38_08750 [Gammaproteobacteria bacterium]|nr:hypothetical protein [Gammaproteobacteria bacterium]